MKGWFGCLHFLVVLLLLVLEVLGLDGLLHRECSVSVEEGLVSSEHLLAEERSRESESENSSRLQGRCGRKGKGDSCSPVFGRSDDGGLSVKEID